MFVIPVARIPSTTIWLHIIVRVLHSSRKSTCSGSYKVPHRARDRDNDFRAALRCGGHSVDPGGDPSVALRLAPHGDAHDVRVFN